MRRLLTLLLATVLALGAIAPVSVGAAASDAGDVCPMMRQQVEDGPCIGEPCPCHHGGSDSTLPDGVRLTLPEAAGTAPARATTWTRTDVRDATLRAGVHPPVDHPPDLPA